MDGIDSNWVQSSDKANGASSSTTGEVSGHMATAPAIQRLAEALDGLIAAVYDLSGDGDTSWLRPLINVRSDLYDLLREGSALTAADFEDVCRETRRWLGSDRDSSFAREWDDHARAWPDDSLASAWLREVLAICGDASQRPR